MLQEAWTDAEKIRSGMVVLYKSLRLAKYCCKSLNRNKYSNIQQRANEAYQVMVEKQSMFLYTPSQAFFEEEKEARESGLFWYAAEQTFFKQKSCIRWLGEGDANTVFFLIGKS